VAVLIREVSVQVLAEVRVLVADDRHSRCSLPPVPHVARSVKYHLSQMAKSLSTAKSVSRQMAVPNLVKVATIEMNALLHDVISIDLVLLSGQMLDQKVVQDLVNSRGLSRR